jgi:hypothetical protein
MTVIVRTPGYGAYSRAARRCRRPSYSTVLIVAFYFLEHVIEIENDKEINVLPLMAVGGVVVLITMLTIVTMTFSLLGLTNPKAALGLPEGSIRAVLARSLVVLFAILAVFLDRGVYLGGPKSIIENLSLSDAMKFQADHPMARQIKIAHMKNPNEKNPDEKNDGTAVYELSYRAGTDNEASNDFAKQLLVLLGTLMTAITSFYLGSAIAHPPDRRSSAPTGADERPRPAQSASL